KVPWGKEEVLGVELVFVPYHLFRYQVRSQSEPGVAKGVGVIAVDALVGTPVVVQGEKIEPQTVRVNQEVVYGEQLDRERAAELVRKRAPELLQRTMRGGRSSGHLDVEHLDSLHLPYWIGVYRRRGKVYYGVVIDGNRPDIAPGVLELIRTAETVKE
ncbi:hypothetical protein ACFLT7_02850, partial [candidate division KSB1 bacterium]